MSPIYENALDSLRIGFQFFEQEKSYSSRKHAILTIYHAVELLMKERLRQIHPNLIYKNIDAPITDDALTVGLKDILIRLKNFGVALPADQIHAVERIQKKRNKIEHHRYDHNEQEDDAVIGEALQVVLYFIEFVLSQNPDADLGQELAARMRQRVFSYQELRALADNRLEAWMKKEWPHWDPEKDNLEEFEGTYDCPVCFADYLVVGYHAVPFCFHCNAHVAAAICDNCGRSYLIENGCCDPDDPDDPVRSNKFWLV